LRQSFHVFEERLIAQADLPTAIPASCLAGLILKTQSGCATELTIRRGPRSRDAVTLRRIQPSRVDAEPEESREWGIFTEHRAIDRLPGRR